LERGRGARLAPLAEKLLEIDERLRARLAPQLAALAQEAGDALAELAPPQGLRMEASHDLALEGLRRLAPRGLALDLQFRGSLESLDAFAAGRCDLAGFHVPADELAAPLAPRLRRPLQDARVRLIRLADRVQGIMVRRSGARRIRRLQDLAGKGTRFVNRQRGSGTRLLLDLLLAGAKIAPESISGYDSEEFTHAAVAATVASGMADAGFGVEAAASQAGLAFVPVAREHYFLACREGMLPTGPGRALLRLLRGGEFRRLVARLPGYDASRAGEVETVPAALPWLQAGIPGRRAPQAPMIR
jgi:molybdate-binding protein